MESLEHPATSGSGATRAVQAAHGGRARRPARPLPRRVPRRPRDHRAHRQGEREQRCGRRVRPRPRGACDRDRRRGAADAALGLGRVHDVGPGRTGPPAAAPLLLRQRRLRRRWRSTPLPCSSSRPLDVQIAFGVRPPRSVAPRARIQASRRARLTSRSFAPSSRSSATRRARSSTRWRSSRYLRESSLWLYVPDGADEEVVAEGELTLDGLVESRDAAFGSLFYLRFVHPARSPGEHDGARRRHVSSPGGSRTSSTPVWVGWRAVASCPGSGTGSSRCRSCSVATCPGATAAAAALKYAQIRKEDPRFVYQGRVVAAERLDDLPVLVLLRLQPVAVGVPRCERPRIRLGDDLGLPLRGRRRVSFPSGSRTRRTTSTAPISAAAGTTARSWRSRELIPSSTREPAHTPRTSGAASTRPRCRFPTRSG